VSEQSITRQQPGPRQTGKKRAVGTQQPRWELLWSQISCVEGRRSIKMRELGVQIGNSGLVDSNAVLQRSKNFISPSVRPLVLYPARLPATASLH
jgi:hypothetical protein